MSDLCFCHLNGYKVKDADARRSIEELETKKVDNTTMEVKETEINGKIEGVKTDLNNLETRFNTMKVTGEAEDIVFKNASTGLEATNVQDAITEVKEMASRVAQGTAQGTTYDNTASELEATNVQSAIDEVKNMVDNVNDNVNEKLENADKVETVNLTNNTTLVRCGKIRQLCLEGETNHANGSFGFFIPEGDRPLTNTRFNGRDENHPSALFGIGTSGVITGIYFPDNNPSSVANVSGACSGSVMWITG